MTLGALGGIMNEGLPNPGSKEDMLLAARLVVEGVLPESTVRAVLAKQKELSERGHPLSAAEICLRKSFVTLTELRWLQNCDRPPANLLPGLTLEPLLGQGGMSRVYPATDQEAGVRVAVKVLHPRLRRDSVSLEDFRREARLLCGLEHENIVRGYRLQSHDGVEFLVMELVNGRSIQEHLDKAGRFDEDAALYIILQTARALTKLHEIGMVHRDVKPGNILIDMQNTVKLCDLGLAVGSGGSASEVTAGTADYIAPEQAQGADGIDVRSDIYALGVTLYQLVVGKLPFSGQTNQETMAQRLLDELRSPDLKGLQISPHVHYFVQKMMALDREVRYQSPVELISDIEEQIRGKKTLTAQPGRVQTRDVDLKKPFTPAGPKPSGNEWPTIKRRPR